MEPILSRLKIKNFKSIGEKGVDLELKPLTILVGPNGSGKSSILEALALLAANVEQDEFRLKGELTQSFDTPQQIAHKHELSRWITWEIHLPDNTGVRYEHKLDSAEKREIIIKAGKDILQTSLIGDMRRGHSLVTGIPGGKDIVMGNTLYPLGDKKYRYDLHSVSEWNSLVEILPEGELRAVMDSAASTTSQLAKTLKQHLFLLSGLRGEVLPHANTGDIPRWVGIKGEGLIPLLNILQSPLYGEPWENIQRWARKFSMPKLKPFWGGANKLEVHFMDPQLKIDVNLAFAGQGSRQLAPVITQLFWSPGGSLIMIEEPEISLHPEAQVKLGELFADAILEKKQIIATTHSDFLLLSLSRAVQKGLSVDDIAVYEITKGREGTKAKSVKLSKRGYPLGWPPSYAKVQRDVTLNWAASLPRE